MYDSFNINYQFEASSIYNLQSYTDFFLNKKNNIIKILVIIIKDFVMI